MHTRRATIQLLYSVYFSEPYYHLHSSLPSNTRFKIINSEKLRHGRHVQTMNVTEQTGRNDENSIMDISNFVLPKRKKDT